MGRFRAEDADKYGGNGGAGYFSLSNDKDVAQVRFMYDTADDVEGYAVHQVEIDGRKRYVNCLRDYGQPLDDCPFCKNRMPQFAKLFIPVYNLDQDKMQIWERGKKFFAKMSSICSRYATNGALFAHIFEIERNGKKGDTSTTYEIYEVDKDEDITLDDLPEVPEILGGLVLDKSAEEMDFYLENGYFQGNGDDTESVRRRGTNRSESRNESRRTPRRNGSEAF